LVAFDVVVVISEVSLVIEEALELAEEDFERMALSMPTQYEILTQKLVIQSFETAGFHLRKSACEILKAVSTEKHESPDLTVYHLLQFEAVFGRVGPEGLSTWQKTPMGSSNGRTLNKTVMFKTLSFSNRVYGDLSPEKKGGVDEVASLLEVEH